MVIDTEIKKPAAEIDKNADVNKDACSIVMVPAD